MVLVGGAGTIYGPVLAAFLLTVGSEQLAGLGNLRHMIVSVLIVLTLRFLPGGLWSLWRTYGPPGLRSPRQASTPGAHATFDLKEHAE
jgi:ABC-type branched-subunit amino acid transport system permease subunit